jgi:hypothetical protein
MSLGFQLGILRGRFLWRSFQQQLEHPREAQQALLCQILSQNQGTRFGLRHSFARMQSVADYQAGVPIADYEGFRPWIEQLQLGERNVLTSEHPFMFALTSGTTGQPKYIPITKSSRQGTARVTAMWVYRCLADHPKAFDGKALIVVSPAVEGLTPCGIPFGSASGYIYQNSTWAIRHISALPYSLFCIKDYGARYYAMMRFAIEQNISFISTPNPSTIKRLVTIADQRRDQLIRDIRDGVISQEMDIEPDLKRELQRSLKPNARRARELEHILSEVGFLDPKAYWPDLAVIGCWKGGTVGATVEQLGSWFSPEVGLRDIGYLASEAQMSLPITDHGCGGILAVGTNFYEFIPEAEMGRTGARILTAKQLEEGVNYYLLLTTTTGLYRYDINDVVRVTGFYRHTPVIEFVRKGRDMVSLTGEKLHVEQVIQALKAAQDSIGVVVEHYRMVGDVDACRYDLKLELKAYPVPDDALLALGRSVDKHLGALNIEYDQKRRSGRLGPPCIHVMSQGWHTRRLQAKLASGLRDVQFKDTLLGLPDAEDGLMNPAKILTL